MPDTTNTAVSVSSHRNEILLRKAIEYYYDFGDGDKPRRRTMAEVAEHVGVTEATIIAWFRAVDRGFLDTITPQWVVNAATHEYVAANVPILLQRMMDIAKGDMARAKIADQLNATKYLLSLAGISAGTFAPKADPEEDDKPFVPPIVVSVQIGGTPASHGDIIDMTAG